MTHTFTERPPGVRSRVQAVDVLRGLVMVIMALDHTRDFVHAAAMVFQPEDLRQTTPAIFFTRWITHFCAPVFMLTAGMGAHLRGQRGGTRWDLSRFLWARGFWLIALEFTASRAGFFLDLSFDPLLLLVLWALGWSMITLGLLIHVPFGALCTLSVGIIVLHNLFDGIAAASVGPFGWLWRILHVQGVLSTDPTVIVAYPLIPWIGVMSAGYCLGRVYDWPPERRRKRLLQLGLCLTLGFVVIRALNVYGDPRPWSVQDRPLFTLLSFLNVTKYPASLAFLLMTLGPALIGLAWFDRLRLSERHPFVVFGRVPLFYYLLHIPLAHGIAIGLTLLRYGRTTFLFTPPPTLGTPRDRFPADYGWDLWVVYAVWIAVVLALYPTCRWFAAFRARQRYRWLS